MCRGWGRKKRKVRDIESEYPKWPWVDYNFQDAKFFKEVRKLQASGFDPKGEIIDKYVIVADIVGIFGNVLKFKIMNPLLIEEQKKLEKITGKFMALVIS
jgi:hypothetical protein